MRNCNKKVLTTSSGITLIALVVTIIVLLILAGVTINIALNNNGLLQKAKDVSELYKQAEQNELQQLSEFTDEIDEKTGASLLSEEKIQKIVNRIKDTTKELQQIEYEAKEITDDMTSESGKGRSVTIEGTYSGAGSDQVFFQSEVGAIGTKKVKWYVLSADERGVNLVSSITYKKVIFNNSQGYDNCLHFLNELSKKLFINEEYGITEDRIHALNLSDIKMAAEQVNSDCKVTENGEERYWNWDLDFVNGATSKCDFFNNSHTYTSTGYTYHPVLYPIKEETTEVEANNGMFDETPNNKIMDNGIKRDELGNPASKLTIFGTQFSYYNNGVIMANNLYNFGNNNMYKELFSKNGGTYWIATRCVNTYGGYGGLANYCLYVGESNYLTSYHFCGSSGSAFERTYPFRVVISVPANRVNIADDGTVTLKAK